MQTVHDDPSEGYRGPDRRRHRVFVTTNSEYHCRDGVCLAVRSRRTGAFQRGHVAIGRHLNAGLALDEQGIISAIFEPAAMSIGHRMWLSAGDEDPAHEIITSRVRSMDRPPKDDVAGYPS